MNFIRFHSVSFGGPARTYLLKGSAHQNETERNRMKPNEIHSGGIQDPRSKIAEGSFTAILDPGPSPNETE